MPAYKFYKGEVVAFNNGVKAGIGKVLGVAMAEQPVVGCLYILQDLSHAIECEEYPFDCFACQECNLYKADKPSEVETS